MSGVDTDDLGELDEDQLREVIEEWLDFLTGHVHTLFGRALVKSSDVDLYTSVEGIVIATAADMIAKAAQHRVQPTVRKSDFDVVSINTVEVIERMNKALQPILDVDREKQAAAQDNAGLRLHVVGRPGGAG